MELKKVKASEEELLDDVDTKDAQLSQAQADLKSSKEASEKASKEAAASLTALTASSEAEKDEAVKSAVAAARQDAGTKLQVETAKHAAALKEAKEKEKKHSTDMRAQIRALNEKLRAAEQGGFGGGDAGGRYESDEIEMAQTEMMDDSELE